MGNGGRLHIHGKRVPGGPDRLPSALVRQEGLPCDHPSKHHRVLPPGGRLAGQGQQPRIRREHGGRQPGVKLRQNLRADIVVSGLRGDHRVKYRKARRQGAGGPHVEDRPGLIAVNENLGGQGRVDLADPAEQRDHIHAVEGPLIEAEHGLSGLRDPFHVRQKGRCLTVARAQNPNFLLHFLGSFPTLFPGLSHAPPVSPGCGPSIVRCGNTTGAPRCTPPSPPDSPGPPAAGSRPPGR